MVAGPFDTMVNVNHRGKPAAEILTLGVDALKGSRLTISSI